VIGVGVDNPGVRETRAATRRVSAICVVVCEKVMGNRGVGFFVVEPQLPVNKILLSRDTLKPSIEFEWLRDEAWCCPHLERLPPATTRDGGVD
jgi:hypothetical protein